ncbi:WhiB family transcriptional regulator [Streptomyces sp. NPDC002730]|uniref:WhiB family transcriptional regulator n=1 Tax=Streptomyces sp. NPDC002730 TaxID=3364662 RepID=UPI0036CC79D3
MSGLIAGTRNGHLTGRTPGAWELGFELAPDPGLAAALCKGIEPELFFPERGDRPTAALAREICAQCPVVEACLTDALASEGSAGHANRFGIRGGKSPEERHAIYLGTRWPALVDDASESAPALRQIKPKREPAKCGTRGGYQRHLRQNEEPCDPCRFANTEADRRLRSTGSTKGAAA